ncbi:hypothetical protein CALCODRAFT_487239, partial [Calocera cornea HHB12733]
MRWWLVLGRRASKSPGPCLPIFVLSTTGVLAAAVVLLAAAALPASAAAPVPVPAAAPVPASVPARSPALAALATLAAAPSRLRTSIWRASASSKRDAPRPNFTGHRHLTLYERFARNTVHRFTDEPTLLRRSASLLPADQYSVEQYAALQIEDPALLIANSTDLELRQHWSDFQARFKA